VLRAAAGDLHLADIRAWREGLLAGLGLQLALPLWAHPPGSNYEALAAELRASGVPSAPLRLPAAPARCARWATRTTRACAARSHKRGSMHLAKTASCTRSRASGRCRPRRRWGWTARSGHEA
jgi:hypothetical protein